MERRDVGIVGAVIATFLAVFLIIYLFFPSLLGFTLLGVSKVEIDPTTTGYLDPASGEWKGSFWLVTMSTDFDDQVAGFMLQNEDGEPGETFAVSGNVGGISDKKYATDDEVDGKVLIPTAQVMVHITPSQPYYEREMEIQQGHYIKTTYATKTDLGGANRRKYTSIKVDAIPFIHYSFADVGGGNWVLHTPFTVDLYKNGELTATEKIDTTGGTETYRLPASGNEFINIIDLGKLDTSGYGCPIWEDILYFSDNHIFVRSPTADNLLRYDSGVKYSGPGSPGYLPSHVNSFSTNWFSNCRWSDDSSPAAFKLPGLTMVQDGDYQGWDKDGYVVSPNNPDIFSDIIPYLQKQGIQKVSMPTGFSHLEKVYYDGDKDGQSENYLRVHFNYGTKSSLLVVKISTELADTIVWQPQVGNFKITDFKDFGDIINIKTNTITIKCVEGAGTAIVSFTKTSGAPISITPKMSTPRLETGDSYTLNINVQNLGTTEDFEGEIVAKVSNILGSVTDTATAQFKLLKKTGATTIVHVITEYDGKPISNLPVMLEYAGTSQTKTTGLDGIGVATFSLGTSADVSVTASYAGGDMYLPKSKTVDVAGGTETTITLSLLMEGETEPPDDLWLWIIMGIIVATVLVAVAVYVWRRWYS